MVTVVKPFKGWLRYIQGKNYATFRAENQLYTKPLSLIMGPVLYYSKYIQLSPLSSKVTAYLRVFTHNIPKHQLNFQGSHLKPLHITNPKPSTFTFLKPMGGGETNILEYANIAP